MTRIMKTLINLGLPQIGKTLHHKNNLFGFTSRREMTSIVESKIENLREKIEDKTKESQKEFKRIERKLSKLDRQVKRLELSFKKLEAQKAHIKEMTSEKRRLESQEFERRD